MEDPIINSPFTSGEERGRLRTGGDVHVVEQTQLESHRWVNVTRRCDVFVQIVVFPDEQYCVNMLWSYLCLWETYLHIFFRFSYI